MTLKKLFPRLVKWSFKTFNPYILERNDKLLKCLTNTTRKTPFFDYFSTSVKCLQKSLLNFSFLMIWEDKSSRMGWMIQHWKALPKGYKINFLNVLICTMFEEIMGFSKFITKILIWLASFNKDRYWLAIKLAWPY
jgi:hypothetical protein